jgi:hypothetical protein
VSFFDEDDEPVRTTTRSRSRDRAQPRPRRGRPAGGASSADQQTILVRRMLGVIGVVLVILILGLLVHSCSTNRHKDALGEYNRQANTLASESAQTGSQFFRQMNGAQNQSPEDLQQSISSFKVQADEQLKQAQNLSVPDEMKPAQQSLLIGLELRRDGLEAIAADIRTALGDSGRAADAAIGRIAGQMQSFTASDVLYSARVVPFIKDALTKADVSATIQVAPKFLNDISWQSSQFVAQKLGQQLTTGGGGGGQSNQPTGPGLHGTGLNGTSYGNTTLQPGVTNRLTYVAGQAFTVSFTNQGDNDEFNVKVSLEISRASGTPITITRTVQKVAQGEKATVTLPLNRTPPVDTAVTINVNVAPVPGEKKTDNNKSSYPTLFVKG